MALIAGVLALPDISSSSANSTTLAGTTSTAAIVVTPNTLIAINATQDMSVRFSGSAAVTAAVATDFRIPANSTFTFSVSENETKMFFYNDSSTTLTYWWQYLSKF